jgi:hypothetical protein
VERYLDTPLLSDANEKIPCHPEVITHRDSFAGTDLELPLRRHHFGVNATDVNAGIQARAVVGLDEITGEDFAGTYDEILNLKSMLLQGATYRHHNSKDPEAQGNLLLANHKESHLRQGECILARDRTKEFRFLPAP